MFYSLYQLLYHHFQSGTGEFFPWGKDHHTLKTTNLVNVINGTYFIHRHFEWRCDTSVSVFWNHLFKGLWQCFTYGVLPRFKTRNIDGKSRVPQKSVPRVRTTRVLISIDRLFVDRSVVLLVLCSVSMLFVVFVWQHFVPYHMQIFSLHPAASCAMSPALHVLPKSLAESSNLHPGPPGQHRDPAADPACPISMWQGSRLPFAGLLTIWV
jgi:hypothetical protein